MQDDASRRELQRLQIENGRYRAMLPRKESELKAARHEISILEKELLREIHRRSSLEDEILSKA